MTTTPRRRRLRTGVTINPTILDRAHQMMLDRGYDSFSALVENLIRDEWTRAHAPALLHSIQPPISSAPSPAAHADGIVVAAQAETRRTRR